MPIAGSIARIKSELPSDVQLIAVSKTVSVDVITEAYQAGQRAFGENKVQELLQKQPVLPSDIDWHLIGHLQTNKVKYLVPFVKLIHSVDSLKLLFEINKEASKINRTVDCLIQIHIASEESKFGLTFDEADQLFKSAKNSGNVRIIGLMGMATFTDDMKQVRKEFESLHAYFLKVKEKWYPSDTAFRELSMGMSGDYKIAIEAGSTMVRIGSLLFGERNVNK